MYTILLDLCAFGRLGRACLALSTPGSFWVRAPTEFNQFEMAGWPSLSRIWTRYPSLTTSSLLCPFFFSFPFLFSSRQSPARKHDVICLFEYTPHPDWPAEEILAKPWCVERAFVGSICVPQNVVYILIEHAADPRAPKSVIPPYPFLHYPLRPLRYGLRTRRRQIATHCLVSDTRVLSSFSSFAGRDDPQSLTTPYISLHPTFHG